MSTSTQAPAYSAKCLICGDWLPMETEAEIEAARKHTAACAKSGNPAREVVMTTTVKLPDKWVVKS